MLKKLKKKIKKFVVSVADVDIPKLNASGWYFSISDVVITFAPV